jgi:SAM-dependent methyltransferase
VDYNSEAAISRRYEQLLKVCDTSEAFSILDYGCGYGSLAGYLSEHGFQFTYWGYDFSEKMIEAAQNLHGGDPRCTFTHREGELPRVDYVVESGIFNMKLDARVDDWTSYVLEVLEKMDSLSARGFAFNLLTSYSDPERMRPDLYYADPFFYFDACKRRFSRNVALLHDYDLYDFTVIVRKLLR